MAGEMDAMDAERCAEVASLRDALARLRAEKLTRNADQFADESHERREPAAAEPGGLSGGTRRIGGARRRRDRRRARDERTSRVARSGTGDGSQRVEAEKERMKKP